MKVSKRKKMKQITISLTEEQYAYLNNAVFNSSKHVTRTQYIRALVIRDMEIEYPKKPDST